MIRGVSFEIPNEYGYFLKDGLAPVNIAALNWRIDNEEVYVQKNDKLHSPLFPNDKDRISGSEFARLIATNPYYMIFVELRAFAGSDTSYPETFEQFLASNCELVLLVVDSIYVTIYCKDQSMIRSLYEHAVGCGFEEVDYVNDKNDSRTSLKVW